MTIAEIARKKDVSRYFVMLAIQDTGITNPPKDIQGEKLQKVLENLKPYATLYQRKLAKQAKEQRKAKKA